MLLQFISKIHNHYNINKECLVPVNFFKQMEIIVNTTYISYT